MYTAYYYNMEKDQMPGIDSNELYINDKFVSMITEVRSSDSLENLQPESELEKLVLIVSEYSELNIRNYNPCPEEL